METRCSRPVALAKLFLADGLLHERRGSISPEGSEEVIDWPYKVEAPACCADDRRIFANFVP